jgi:hypothetical protein
VSDLANDRGDVVQDPGRLQAVDPGPQLRLSELHLLADPDEAVACGLFAINGDRILEVSEEDVDGRGDVGGLGDHLLVREVEEVDHP